MELNVLKPMSHNRPPRFKPLEAARQLAHAGVAEESESPRPNPLEDFEQLFHLVNPNSLGLPATQSRISGMMHKKILHDRGCCRKDPVAVQAKC